MYTAGMPVPLLIHAIIQPANRVAVAQCIKAWTVGD